MFKDVDVVVVCPHNIVKVITFFSGRMFKRMSE